MRTNVYIDGYNLFYSVLTGTTLKWLDLHTLYNQYLIRPVEPSSKIVAIKYFTAPALGSMSSDPRVEQRQAHYHRALKASGQIEIIKGYHQKAVTTGFPVEPVPGIEKLKVHIMEEKQTDVNIGLHIYRDAAQQKCDQMVLCSNDADLEPALSMVREDFPDIKIGLVLPRNKERDGTRMSSKLLRYAHWARKYIRTEELEASQFPDRLLDHRNRSIRCPEKWKRISNKA